ncbi:MAG: nitroreductase [Bacteroidales bacterium]|nr:nitroreductase [Bacteroidales bacterium]
MDYYDLIQSRESIRSYDPARSVPKIILKKILDAGRLAPSACNIQPWKFLVASSPEMLGKLRECYQRDWFRDAPHILVVAGMKDKSWVRSWDAYNSIETDLAIAMAHIILAAENEGLGTCWIAAFNPTVLRKALDLGESEVVYGITPLGYPKPGFVKKGTKNRKSLNEIAEFL